ncbi:hypothetical protein L2E82_14501 [Cichorium intybus]|uniref:Uncharacterized protein n=1 Tax=Cichorium intybus TaxID=13427 RepID=A0ACB9F060_CICIN|nr:hypothetical protein L2E82_14501 [Cichorium intybus]
MFQNCIDILRFSQILNNKTLNLEQSPDINGVVVMLEDKQEISTNHSQEIVQNLLKIFTRFVYSKPKSSIADLCS